MNECLKSAQHNLCIQSVFLKESKVFLRDDIDLPTLDRDGVATQTFRSVTRVKEISLIDADDNEIWDYRFTYSIGLRLIFSNEVEESRKDDYKPIIEVVGVFEAKYFSQKKLEEEERKAFSIDNVGYHVWPYWREFVQSSCTRIGLSPVLEVPVYIIPQDVEKSEKELQAQDG